MLDSLAQKKQNNAAAIEPTLTEAIVRFKRETEAFLQDKPELVEPILCAIIGSGHVLIEDVPGVGKTTFIKAVARMLGLEMMRVQFTSDLLPADMLGVEIFDAKEQTFRFRPGPVFTNLLLADELNRASPRTQSALLEAMSEGAVTVDRNTYDLPHPFIVFAAQNPSDNIGTYALPESQLDRFAVKVALNYPAPDKEQSIFQKASFDPLKQVTAEVMSGEDLVALQAELENIHISEKVALYVRQFVDLTRSHEAVKLGVSTRGGVIWLRLARARAILDGRNYVLPDDLKALAPYCLSHRLQVKTGNDPAQLIEHFLNSVEIS